MAKEPTSEYIIELADELDKEYGDQTTEDERVKGILRREHPVDVQKPEAGAGIKRLISGYPGLIVSQDYSFLTTPPFLRVNPLKPDQDAHADTLEGVLLGCWKLSQGIMDVWLDMVYDFVWAGRGWSKIYPIPEMWSSDFKRREGESEHDFLDRVKEQKEETLPIVWKYVPVDNTWPTFTMRGDLDQVVEIREMKARDIRRHYGDSYLQESSSDTDMIRVIDYADDMHCSVVICGGTEGKTGGVAKSFVHNLGMNPYSLAAAPRSAPQGPGLRWMGVLYHTKDILEELDSLLTDIRYNIKRAVRSQPIFNLDLQSRGVAPENRAKADIIKFKPLEPIILDLNESVKELEPAKTNVDAYRLVEIITTLTREVAVRSVLLGILQSGTTGVLYNTAAQFAQKQYGPAISQLEKTAVGVGRKFFKSIEAFADEDEDVPILFTGTDDKMYRLSAKPKDVRGWGRAIQARIDLAIPINESSDLTNARLATDPNNPLLSYATVAGRYLHVEDVGAEEDRIIRDQIRRALFPVLAELVQTEGLNLLGQPTQEGNQLGDMMAALPPQLQGVIQQHAAATGQPMPASPNMAPNLARGAANSMRTGRLQAPSNTGVGQLRSDTSAP